MGDGLQSQAVLLAKDELSITAAKKPATSIEVSIDSERVNESDENQAKLVHGSVIIRDGKDVAQYAVSTRDDHDPACTFRSFIIGSGLTALAACIKQIYFYKPVEVSFALYYSGAWNSKKFPSMSTAMFDDKPGKVYN